VTRERTNNQLNSHEVPEPRIEPTTHWHHSGERLAYYRNATHATQNTQIYVILNSGNISSTLQALESCAADIKAWSDENMLILNNSKTEILHVFSNFSRNVSNPPYITVGSSPILPKDQTRNLGVLFDNHVNFKSHISNICSTASFALRNIGKIRKYLDGPTTERLVHAFITSRLDTCNSPLFGLPSQQLDLLQRIQNSAARLVSLT
jgi:hypothetical protein